MTRLTSVDLCLEYAFLQNLYKIGLAMSVAEQICDFLRVGDDAIYNYLTITKMTVFEETKFLQQMLVENYHILGK